MAELKKWSESYREVDDSTTGIDPFALAKKNKKETPNARARRGSLMNDVMRLQVCGCTQHVLVCPLDNVTPCCACQSFYGSEFVDDDGHVDADAAFNEEAKAAAKERRRLSKVRVVQDCWGGRSPGWALTSCVWCRSTMAATEVVATTSMLCSSSLSNLAKAPMVYQQASVALQARRLGGEACNKS